MQAFLHFPSWIPGSIHDRSPDKMACSKPRQAPVVEIPLLNKLKRGRTSSCVSSAASDGAVAKKQRLSEGEKPSPVKTSQAAAEQSASEQRETTSTSSGKRATSATHASSASLHAPVKKVVVPAVVTDPERRAELQQKIESQLNLEILLKHNELRLIEQELAKCQIALEQIRRCEAIPYPGEPGSTIPPEQISTGVGPALEPPSGFALPPQPAPWGVMDGPYSRHYAQWLIPDPQFDPSPFQSPRCHAGSRSFSALDGRPTRGGLSDRRLAGKSRAGGSVSAHLQALSTSYATPKDKQGPLIIKRPSDGQLVKLVCNECHRDNFSSVQGFLNHCRIAHGRNLDSHGAAANACGVPVETSEAPALETPVQPEPTVITPQSGRPLVHPFITSTGPASGSGASTPTTLTAAPALPEASRPQKPAATAKASKLDNNFKFPKDMASGQFVPSSQTPRLSALVQKHGLGADFNKMVDQAKQKIDLEQVEELDQDDDEDQDTSEAMDIAQPPASAPKSTGKPKSALGGVRVPVSRARPTPLRTNLNHSKASSATSEVVVLDTPTEEERTGFSPQSIETNPGLISDRDDEDYEDHTSRSSEDEWSEHGVDHSVQVRHHHHGDDEVMSHILGEDGGVDGATTCATVNSPMTSSPMKRRRGRPSKRGRKR